MSLAGSARSKNPILALEAGIVAVAFLAVWLAVDVLPGADTIGSLAAPLVGRVVDLRAWGLAYLVAAVVTSAAFTVGEDLLIHHRQRDSWWTACMALAAVGNFLWVWLALIAAYVAPPADLIARRATAGEWQVAAVTVGAALLTLVPQNIWMPALGMALANVDRQPSRRWLLAGAAVVAAGWLIVGGR